MRVPTSCWRRQPSQSLQVRSRLEPLGVARLDAPPAHRLLLVAGKAHWEVLLRARAIETQVCT